MRSRWVRLVVGAGTLLGGVALAPGLAAAAPASAAFLTQWEKVDRLYVSWDITAAERALNPLLSEARKLEGYERVWFGLTAARVLAYVERDSEASTFIADQQTITGGLCPTAECIEAARYVPWSARDGKDPRATLIGSPEPIGDIKPKDFRARPIEGFVHYSEFLKPVEGGSGALPSYFGTPLYWHGATKPKNESARAQSHIANYLPARFSGGPTGPASGTSKALVSIPSAHLIVEKRSVQAGAAIPVQVYNTRPKQKLIATWVRAGSRRPLRVRHEVRSHRVVIRAPRQRGLYDLKLGVGRKQDVATAITRVGVGLKPSKQAKAPQQARS